jgi:hypothetical protein
MAYARCLRTLPLRVEPLPGEAIDSWLEAVARTHRATFGSVLDQCGIDTRSLNRKPWQQIFLAPPPGVINNIAYTTGMSADAVRAMTLSPAEGDSVLNRHRWAWRRSSRACPHCLAETGGRWFLHWRHNLCFICTKHNCVLIDACASCGRPWRTRRHHASVIPTENCCPNPPNTAMPGKGLMCGAYLPALQTIGLPDDHSATRAQRLICDHAGHRRQTAPSLYGTSVRADDVLEDLRVLARWMLQAAELTALDQILSTFDAPILGKEAAPAVGSPDRFTERAGVHPVAIDVAIGNTLALAVLDSPTPRAARELLSLVMAVVRPEWALRLVRGRGREHLSDDVAAVLVAAFDSVFRGQRTHSASTRGD